jgi:hypothetical protein
MTEQNQIRQTENLSAGPQGHTGGARYGAERKPMVSWAALLDEAVKKPGFIHDAYSRFHNFSLGNQLLALYQCVERGLQPAALASFRKWKELGRHVKKGEKALICASYCTSFAWTVSGRLCSVFGAGWLVKVFGVTVIEVALKHPQLAILLHFCLGDSKTFGHFGAS